MNIIAKVFVGIIATVLLTAVWTAGNPPAVSFFWKTQTVEVVGHVTDDWETGFGVVKRTTPEVINLPDASKRVNARLMIENLVEERAKIVDAWEIGTRVKVRLHPSRDIAYPTSTWPFMTVPSLVFSAVLFFLIASQIHSFFGASKTTVIKGKEVEVGAGTGWIIALFMLIFSLGPIGLFVFALNFGEPPPKSLFWPRQSFEVVSAEPRIFNVGNGTRAAYVDLLVKSEGEAGSEPILLKGVTYSSVSIREARRIAILDYKAGQHVTGLKAPNGDFFLARLRFTDGFAAIAAFMMLLSFGAVRVLWRAVF